MLNMPSARWRKPVQPAPEFASPVLRLGTQGCHAMIKNSACDLAVFIGPGATTVKETSGTGWRLSQRVAVLAFHPG